MQAGKTDKKNRIKIAGPPGTGKTYTLVEKYLRSEIERGTPQSKILYIGFSNATVDEARKRINQTFPGNEIIISTLHSFGKFHLKLPKDGLLTGNAWTDFATRFGHSDISFDAYRDEDTGVMKYKDVNMQVIEYAKNKCIPIERLGHAAYELGKETQIRNIYRTQQIYQDIESYKRDYHKYEFSDMIKRFVEDDCRPSLCAVFLDEAQDLNPLEWKMFYHIEQLCERSYIAGDDDQAIYAFKGGVASEFINIQGTEDPQINSNRVPKLIHKEAVKILMNIKERLPKQWNPRDEEGEVYHDRQLHNIDFEKENWLILTRKNDQHSPIVQYLEDKNLYFKSNKSKILQPKYLDGWRAWDLLNKGEVIEASFAKKIYKLLRTNKPHNHLKKNFSGGKSLDAVEYVSLKELKDNHGLLIDGDWRQLVMPDTTKMYIEKLLAKGEDLHAEPRIRVSTIHKMKGGESDNLILFTDMSEYIYNQCSKRRSTKDTEHRVFFVAVTRAKKRLYYMQLDPMSPFHYVPGKDLI